MLALQQHLQAENCPAVSGIRVVLLSCAPRAPPWPGQARSLADKMDQHAKIAQEATRKLDQLREEVVSVYVRLESLPKEPLPVSKTPVASSSDVSGDTGFRGPPRYDGFHQGQGAGGRQRGPNHLRADGTIPGSGKSARELRRRRFARECRRRSEWHRRCVHEGSQRRAFKARPDRSRGKAAFDGVYQHPSSWILAAGKRRAAQEPAQQQAGL
eukprot:6154667-Amphidinium_carterae.6